MKNFLGQNYIITRKNVQNIVTYKEKIKEEFKNSEIWKKISDSFDRTSLDDILININ
jgi:hypothetical protein